MILWLLLAHATALTPWFMQTTPSVSFPFGQCWRHSDCGVGVECDFDKQLCAGVTTGLCAPSETPQISAIAVYSPVFFDTDGIVNDARLTITLDWKNHPISQQERRQAERVNTTALLLQTGTGVLTAKTLLPYEFLTAAEPCASTDPLLCTAPLPASGPPLVDIPVYPRFSRQVAASYVSEYTFSDLNLPDPDRPLDLEDQCRIVRVEFQNINGCQTAPLFVPVCALANTQLAVSPVGQDLATGWLSGSGLAITQNGLGRVKATADPALAIPAVSIPLFRRELVFVFLDGFGNDLLTIAAPPAVLPSPFSTVAFPPADVDDVTAMGLAPQVLGVTIGFAFVSDAAAPQGTEWTRRWVRLPGAPTPLLHAARPLLVNGAYYDAGTLAAAVTPTGVAGPLPPRPVALVHHVDMDAVAAQYPGNVYPDNTAFVLAMRLAALPQGVDIPAEIPVETVGVARHARLGAIPDAGARLAAETAFVQYLDEQSAPISCDREPGAGIWETAAEFANRTNSTQPTRSTASPVLLFDWSGATAAAPGYLVLTHVRFTPGGTQWRFLANISNPERVFVPLVHISPGGVVATYYRPNTFQLFDTSYLLYASVTVFPAPGPVVPFETVGTHFSSSNNGIPATRVELDIRVWLPMVVSQRAGVDLFSVDRPVVFNYAWDRANEAPLLEPFANGPASTIPLFSTGGYTEAQLLELDGNVAHPPLVQPGVTYTDVSASVLNGVHALLTLTVPFQTARSPLWARVRRPVPADGFSVYVRTGTIAWTVDVGAAVVCNTTRIILSTAAAPLQVYLVGGEPACPAERQRLQAHVRGGFPFTPWLDVWGNASAIDAADRTEHAETPFYSYFFSWYNAEARDAINASNPYHPTANNPTLAFGFGANRFDAPTARTCVQVMDAVGLVATACTPVDAKFPDAPFEVLLAPPLLECRVPDTAGNDTEPQQHVTLSVTEFLLQPDVVASDPSLWEHLLEPGGTLRNGSVLWFWAPQSMGVHTYWNPNIPGYLDVPIPTFPPLTLDQPNQLPARVRAFVNNTQAVFVLWYQADLPDPVTGDVHWCAQTILKKLVLPPPMTIRVVNITRTCTDAPCCFLPAVEVLRAPTAGVFVTYDPPPASFSPAGPLLCADVLYTITATSIDNSVCPASTTVVAGSFGPELIDVLVYNPQCNQTNGEVSLFVAVRDASAPAGAPRRLCLYWPSANGPGSLLAYAQSVTVAQLEAVQVPDPTLPADVDFANGRFLNIAANSAHRVAIWVLAPDDEAGLVYSYSCDDIVLDIDGAFVRPADPSAAYITPTVVVDTARTPSGGLYVVQDPLRAPEPALCNDASQGSNTHVVHFVLLDDAPGYPPYAIGFTPVEQPEPGYPRTWNQSATVAAAEDLQTDGGQVLFRFNVSVRDTGAVQTARWLVTVTSAALCQYTVSLDLQSVPPLVVTIVPVASRCAATQEGAILPPIVSGGSPLPRQSLQCTASSAGPVFCTSYQYEWLFPGDVTYAPRDPALLASLVPGVYSLRVRDRNNCTTVANTTILSPLPLLVFTSGTRPATCGSAVSTPENVTIIGGTPPYYIRGLVLVTANTTGIRIDDAALPQSVLSVVVTDAAGCRASTPYFTYNNTTPAPPLVLAVTQNPGCPGVLNGSLTAAPTGGTPPYTCVWRLNNVVAGTLCTLNGAGVGVYQLCVSDAQGCYDCAYVQAQQRAPTRLAYARRQPVNAVACVETLEISARGGRTPRNLSIIAGRTADLVVVTPRPPSASDVQNFTLAPLCESSPYTIEIFDADGKCAPERFELLPGSFQIIPPPPPPPQKSHDDSLVDIVLSVYFAVLACCLVGVAIAICRRRSMVLKDD